MKKYFCLFLLVSSLCAANDNIELLIAPEVIDLRLNELATQINNDYQGKDLTLLMIMKGAICVTSDLMKKITVPFTIEYMRAKSYQGTQSGELTLTGIDKLDIAGKDILLIDDIYDTGKTLDAVMAKLQEMQPKSLKTLILLVKNVPRKLSYRPDYVAFDIENRFVIGYGLDYDEYYRGLPGVYAFINDTPPSAD